jgi:hypothetical protein
VRKRTGSPSARREASRNHPGTRAYEARRAAEEARRQELLARDAEEAKEAEKQREKEWEESLRDRRRDLKRQWLIDHPSESAFTFDYKVWPLLKQQLKEAEYTKEARIQENIQKLRASGLYNF